MTNTSRKGAALEAKAKQILEAQGYLVHRTIRTPVIRGGRVLGSNANDVFGCFDLVAAKAAAALRFIQVKVIGDISKGRAKVEPVAVKFPYSVDGVLAADVRAEVWGWIGGRRDGVDLHAQSFKIQVWDGFDVRWVDEGYELAVDRPKAEVLGEV